jgi:hypothetical protein
VAAELLRPACGWPAAAVAGSLVLLGLFSTHFVRGHVLIA